ncbi:MAG TPA: transglycosylase SLT domain-containing protein [Casimicrobiaceae bacterium]|nr:transglycosylase SLT domain-containing protein [Casimicrobiaceae bacterium]
MKQGVATRCMPLVRRCVLAIAAVAAMHASAQSDADFLAAKAAFERADWRRLDAVAPAVAGHPLERYVRYWQLKSRLDDAPAQAVEDFMARYPDGPLAERLRIEWLKALGKRGDWDRFGANYVAAPGEDLELSCYAVQYQYRSDPSALAVAKPFWFTGSSTPDACEPLFAALIARGDVTPADRKARFRLAVAKGNVGLAHKLADALPGNDRIREPAFVAIDRNPMQAVKAGKFDWKTPAGRALALYALDRAARKDAAEARAAWLSWRSRLPEADRQYGDVRIAWYGARQLDPAANEWFNALKDVALSPEQQVARIRAALRVRAFGDAQRAIAALPDDEQQQPAWRYWRARALAAQGRDDDARSIYASLADRFDYYGLLASDALGRGGAQFAALKAQSLPVADAALASFGARDEVKRAALLARFDLRQESLREWSYAIRGLDDESLQLAAEYARRNGLYDRAIFTAERMASRIDLAMRYLTPYRSQFEAAAREQGIDEELLYGIARQESRFVADIVSSAGAVGLMQLMPGTARWVAKKLAVSGYSPSRIADVDVNTQFGAFYFKHWLDRLGGLPVLAAAAYNAGPSRAQAWRPVDAPLEGAIWVETIPFDETREYVKRVLANTMLYTHALDRPYVSLTQRLGVVTPRDFESVAASEN